MRVSVNKFKFCIESVAYFKFGSNSKINLIFQDLEGVWCEGDFKIICIICMYKFLL